MPVPKPAAPPPIHTVLTELTGWTLARTADLPKSQRFTFGQRIDQLTLDVLLLAVRALHTAGRGKLEFLGELNLQLEMLRVLWRLVHDRGWISVQQLVFVMAKIDEAGRMVGGWIRHVEALPQNPTPRRSYPP
jgi:hypothetical protein